jgi:hypothetical protein
MSNPETALIKIEGQVLPPFQFNDAAKLAKSQALEQAALIGKVSDRDSKIIAVRAQQALKLVISSIEKDRKKFKEPLLNAGRQLDNLCAQESLLLEQEFGRVSAAVTEFDDAERRRVLEEERLQRLELERIEREKQAELKRIADEQAAREERTRHALEEAARKVREAQEAAAQLAREATNKKQREAAEKARVESERQKALAEAEKTRQEAVMREERAKSEAQSAAVEEKAGDAAYCAAKPVEITKVFGQRQQSNWVITVEQPFVLAKYHPDLVDIKPRLADIKAALNEGREIHGIKAVREHLSGVRLPQAQKAIDV